MFCGCSSLSSLTIPSSVTSVGVNGYWNGQSRSHSSFSGCTALTSITCNADTQPGISTYTFQGIATGGTLYHPESSDYSNWLSNNQYYLGYYLWNDGVVFNLENVSTYYMLFTPIASGSGFSQSVFITANKPDYQVSVSSVQDATGNGSEWLTVSGTPAVGYTEFKVYPTSSADTQRMCWVQVSYGGRIYATITVNQEGEGSSGITSDASVLMKWRFSEIPQNLTYITDTLPQTVKINGTTVQLTYTGGGYSYQMTSGEHVVELYYNSGTTNVEFGSSKNLVGFYIFKDVVTCN